jgi:predicted amidophosphoribosyltransferase
MGNSILCKSCGTRLPENAGFCLKCGRKVDRYVPASYGHQNSNDNSGPPPLSTSQSLIGGVIEGVIRGLFS